MNQSENKLIKGIVFESAVNFLREKSGEEAVKELEKSHGNLIFNQHQMYPLTDLLKLQNEIVKNVYGQEIEKGFGELGKFEFNSFADTVVGATLTNVATSPIKLLEKIQEIWDTVSNFGSRELLKSDDKENSVVVRIKDDPRPPTYIQGVLEEGLKRIGVKAKTRLQERGQELYEIELSW